MLPTKQTTCACSSSACCDESQTACTQTCGKPYFEPFNYLNAGGSVGQLRGTPWAAVFGEGGHQVSCAWHDGRMDEHKTFKTTRSSVGIASRKVCPRCWSVISSSKFSQHVSGCTRLPQQPQQQPTPQLHPPLHSNADTVEDWVEDWVKRTGSGLGDLHNPKGCEPAEAASLKERAKELLGAAYHQAVTGCNETDADNCLIGLQEHFVKKELKGVLGADLNHKAPAAQAVVHAPPPPPCGTCDHECKVLVFAGEAGLPSGTKAKLFPGVTVHDGGTLNDLCGLLVSLKPRHLVVVTHTAKQNSMQYLCFRDGSGPEARTLQPTSPRPHPPSILLSPDPSQPPNLTQVEQGYQLTTESQLVEVVRAAQCVPGVCLESVLLNGCDTHRLASALVQQGSSGEPSVRSAIGWKGDLPIDAAQAFGDEYLRRLAAGLPVVACYRLGKTAVGSITTGHGQHEVSKYRWEPEAEMELQVLQALPSLPSPSPSPSPSRPLSPLPSLVLTTSPSLPSPHPRLYPHPHLYLSIPSPSSISICTLTPSSAVSPCASTLALVNGLILT